MPPRSGCALLDLRALNRVVAFSRELGYVTIEPGVTFEQLAAFMRTRMPDFVPPLLPIPQASVIGNTAERGMPGSFGGLADACALEVVLPTGEVIRTGLARFSGAAAAPVHRFGIGPSLDGLFTQSNLGVITEMTIWVRPKAPLIEEAVFGVSQAHAAAFVDGLRELVLRGVVGELVFANAHRQIATSIQFPWWTGRRPPLGRRDLRELQARAGVPDWTARAQLSLESREHAAAKRRRIRRSLSKICKIQFGLFPPPASIDAAYWRKRTPVPAHPDPDADRVGLFLVNPIIPFKGDDFARAVRLITKVLHRHRFDPILAVRGGGSLGPRCLVIVVFIAWDRDVHGEDGSAMRCYRELSRALQRAGYLPLREAGPARVRKAPSSSSYRALLTALRRTIDPAGILTPSRYEV